MPTTPNLSLPYPVESAPADVPVDLQALAQAIDAYGLTFATPGDLKLSAAIAAPAGWLVCDGRTVSRGAYAALFAAIGTSFGAGDGSSTFGLPDFRGRSPVGVGQGTGLTNRALGATGGEETHGLGVPELPSHAHTLNWSDPGHNHGDPGHAHSIADGGHSHGAPPGYGDFTTGLTSGSPASGKLLTAGSGYGWNYSHPTAGSGTGIGIYAAGTGIQAAVTGIGASVAAAGGGVAHNNMAPFVGVNVLIKT